MIITDDALQEWEIATAQATDGQWFCENGVNRHAAVVRAYDKGGINGGINIAHMGPPRRSDEQREDRATLQHRLNGRFIAIARDAMPALIAEVRRLRSRATEK